MRRGESQFSHLFVKGVVVPPPLLGQRLIVVRAGAKDATKVATLFGLGGVATAALEFFSFFKNINLLLPVYQFALTSSMSLHSGLPVPEVACCGACCLCCLLWCRGWCCGSGGMGPGGDLSTNPRPGVEEGEEERIRRWLIRAPPPPACHTAACCCCCCCCCCCFGMS